jgi:hypothetical protein
MGHARIPIRGLGCIPQDPVLVQRNVTHASRRPSIAGAGCEPVREGGIDSLRRINTRLAQLCMFIRRSGSGEHDGTQLAECGHVDSFQED